MDVVEIGLVRADPVLLQPPGQPTHTGQGAAGEADDRRPVHGSQITCADLGISLSCQGTGLFQVGNPQIESGPGLGVDQTESLAVLQPPDRVDLGAAFGLAVEGVEQEAAEIVGVGWRAVRGEGH